MRLLILRIDTGETELDNRMTLWTMQPIEVWELIQQTGVYHCDPARNSMPEFADSYSWIIQQMISRIGPPPEGVSYPVWAWYSQNGKHTKPDLRGERWGYGPGDEEYTCIEFETPDNQVMLSDFDDWHHVLNKWPIFETEEEYNRYEVWEETVTSEVKKKFLENNWQKIIIINPEENKRDRNGTWIQATVWELRKEMIRHVRFFRTGKYKSR